jgi:hypothetical protein
MPPLVSPLVSLLARCQRLPAAEITALLAAQLGVLGGVLGPEDLGLVGVQLGLGEIGRFDPVRPCAGSRHQRNRDHGAQCGCSAPDPHGGGAYLKAI